MLERTVSPPPADLITPSGRWQGLGPRLTGVIAGLVLMFSMGAELVRNHVSQRQLREETVRNSLRRAAAACAQTVDPGIHKSLTDPSQEGSPPYNEACAKLKAAKTAEEGPDSFAFVYTCILLAGKVHFILDPTLAGDADGDGVDDKSHLMQEYPDASPELIHTLQTGKPSVMAEPQKDQWGTFLSGYAPVKDQSGVTVAVVGVDMKLSQYEGNIRAITNASLLSGLGALVLSVIAGMAVWAYEKRHQQTIQALMKTTENAQAADRAKSRFLATMSHEIRTPMNGVMGITELLRMTPLTDVQRDYLDTIMVSGANLLAIIDEILDYSRIEAGALTLENGPVPVEELLTDIVKHFEPQAVEKGLELQLIVEKGAPAMIVTDAARLRQVLVNLVGNALKFTAIGSVRLRASADTLPGGQPGVRFSVTDTGVGIEPGQMERLFKPFSQGDSSTTRRYGGSGLGLVICERLSRAMGGEIQVDSIGGKGSTFRFTLPAPQAAGRAVIICSDRLLRTLLVRLTEKTGFQAEGVDTVEAALRCLTESPGTLVLLDKDLVTENQIAFAGSLAQQLPPKTRLVVIGDDLAPQELAQLSAAGVIGTLPRVPKVTQVAALFFKSPA